MDFVGLFLNRESPLYTQLYRYFVSGIRSGGIPAGERLPGKRSAAAQLGVSVNTVDTAYQMLAAEGYVRAVPRSGFVVLPFAQLTPPPAAPAAAEAPPRPQWRWSFATGGIDTGLFPRKTWQRLQREVLAKNEDLFAAGDHQGDAPLRGAIAEYLSGWRGVRCTADEVVVGAGLELLLGMLAPLLPAGPVALEDPGYPGTARVLQNAGKQTLPLPVDAAGLAPGPLAQSGARAVYLTPSHQFPTGRVMPAWRRSELLGWAGEAGGLIIEDDYDSEFRFDGRPLASLQGMAPGHVLYASTFSRSLAPGIRAAYLVLPPPLLRRWRAAYGGYACTLWRPEQHTLARFLAGGHFARGLNRLRAAYRRRRDALAKALEDTLAGVEHRLENTHTGLYFLLRLPGRAAAPLAQRARAGGILLRSLNEYASAPLPEGSDALVLGYGGLPDEDIGAAVEALIKALEI